MKKPRPANRIGRKRRAAGWTLLALGLLVAGVWVASGWFKGVFWWGHVNTVIAHGEVGVSTSPKEEYRDIAFVQEPVNWSFWYGWREDDQSTSSYKNWGLISHLRISNRFTTMSGDGLVFWPFPLLLLASGALLLRSGILARRRAITGLCKKCGYDLAGLAPTAPCPECGKASADGAVSTSASGS